ncbi:cofilin [Entomortierella lignicola]|nr:cofilin [Entomortierella lignicola]
MSSSSGVQVDQSCLQAFQDLKIAKKTKYIFFKLSDDLKSVVVESQSETGDYDDFLSGLPEDDCRWAVYDLNFKLDDGGERNKIVFYAWSPDSAKIKSKMLYSSSKDALRRALNGVAIEVQCTAPDEVAYETVLEKAGRR